LHNNHIFSFDWNKQSVAKKFKSLIFDQLTIKNYYLSSPGLFQEISLCIDYGLNLCSASQMVERVFTSSLDQTWVENLPTFAL